MSKAAKKSIFILIGLLLVALAVAGMFYLESSRTEDALEEAEEALENTRQNLTLVEKKRVEDVKSLNDQVLKVTTEKDQFALQAKQIKEQSDGKIKELEGQVSEITDDRDKWKRRIDELRQNRDQLMAKVDELTKQLEEKSEPQVVQQQKESAPSSSTPTDFSDAPTYISETGKVVDEEYWANLVKEKASLEIDIQNLNESLSKKSAEGVETKQRIEDLQIEVNTLKHDKEEMEASIQHKMDMIDNISLELARTKNDKKFIAERVNKLNEENGKLRQEMKKLVSVKNAMEKSVVRLTQEKEKAQDQLGRTETIIQSKIDEIWEIKDDLDQSIRSTKAERSPSGVELPPIVVSSNGESESFNSGQAAPGLQGKVISINEANNFVIVDLGEQAGIRLGDNLSVYRDSKYIARLEVIQIRKDIAAADLKDQWSKVRVGDVVR